MASPEVDRPPNPKKSVTFEVGASTSNSPMPKESQKKTPRESKSGDESERPNNSGYRKRLFRKRSYSLSEGIFRNGGGLSFGSKRWKTDGGSSASTSATSVKSSGSKNVLPSKFLLGGNIRDPLNLNSLSDKIASAVTPESSPVPTPKHRKPEYKIEVLIPPNISDPLNLNAGVDEREYESTLISPAISSKRKKFRYRKRVRNKSVHPDSEGEEEVKKEKKSPPVKPEVPKEKASTSASSSRHHHHYHHHYKQPLVDSEIVSPVVPQPGAYAPPKKYHSRPPNPPNKNQPPPSFRVKNKKFEYGNYNRYYGYRTPDQEDGRLSLFNPEWFKGKAVLDIGCNVGRVTSFIGRHFEPKSIVGIDIDKGLISVARKKLRNIPTDGFPKSMGILYGPLNPTPEVGYYPKNVRFVAANYVVDSDELLETTVPEFDTIMCLSTTKWIHLNFGDDGLKRAFKRIFAQLKPKGKFILEAQGFPSYRKKKKLTPRIFENFNKIKLKPESFAEYLVNEIGFMSFESLQTPEHPSKGFQRPILVFSKGPLTSVRTMSSTYTPFGDEDPSSDQPRRCYAPALTPLYSQKCVKETPTHKKTEESQSPKPGPSDLPKKSISLPSPYYSSITRGPTPPGRTPSIGMTPQYDLGTPSYNPEELDIAPGGYYGYNTPGLTPGYSGPSPDGFSSSNKTPNRGGHSPVYSGPTPGTFSGGSTPGNDESGYTPHYSGYTPSYEGGGGSNSSRNVYAYSPGNATPLHSGSAPSTPNPYSPSMPQSNGSRNGAISSRSINSPQIQQAEISGNTTPHPGVSQSPSDSHQPRYLWYGCSSSGGNTPQSGPEEPSSSPKVYPTQYAYTSPSNSNSPASVPVSPAQEDRPPSNSPP